MNYLINADDFGFTRGFNQAISEAWLKGALNSTSIMVNMPYASDAIACAKRCHGLKTGLHLCLCDGTACSSPSEIPLLVDANGKFKNGFSGLLLLSFLQPKALAKQVRLETRRQIEKLRDSGLEIAHLDSHRHVHMIPLIFRIVADTATEFQIPRVRVVNESLFATIKQTRQFGFLWDGGLVKHLLLTSFARWNAYPTTVYFYSILFTGKVFRERLVGLFAPRAFHTIEVNVHPCVPDVDRQDGVTDSYQLSPNRVREWQAIMDPALFPGLKK